MFNIKSASRVKGERTPTELLWPLIETYNDGEYHAAARFTREMCRVIVSPRRTFFLLNVIIYYFCFIILLLLYRCLSCTWRPRRRAFSSGKSKKPRPPPPTSSDTLFRTAPTRPPTLIQTRHTLTTGFFFHPFFVHLFYPVLEVFGRLYEAVKTSYRNDGNGTSIICITINS